MHSLEGIVDLPEYFFCERTKCKLRKAICIARQRANEDRRAFTAIAFPVCENCEQGKQIGEDVMGVVVNPKRGSGGRNTECQYYSDCSGLASRKDWKSWQCNYCELYQGEDKIAEVENDRVCEDCGDDFTLQPNTPYCAKCMAKRSKEAREKGADDRPDDLEQNEMADTDDHLGEEEIPEVEPSKRLCKKCGENETITEHNPYCAKCMAKMKGSKKKAENAVSDAPAVKAGSTIGKDENAPPRPDLKLTIDFKGHEALYDEIEQIAQKEYRPFDWQLLYMLSVQAQTQRVGDQL